MTARGAIGAICATLACGLSACGGGGSSGNATAPRGSASTTMTPATTSTTAAVPTTTGPPGVTVPNVIGLKIGEAKGELAAIGFATIGLNLPCHKGTLASQSVAEVLAIPGKPPDVRVGAVPLNPGTVVPAGTRIGIIWSGCYGDSSTVPDVIGMTFAAALHAIHAVGLTWACYSVGGPARTTATTTAKASTTVSTGSVTPTAAHHAAVVLTQNPLPGTVLHPGTPVSLTMHHCPQ